MENTIIAVLFLIVLALYWTLLRQSAKRKQRSVWGAWPVKKVSLPELDPIFAQDTLGTSRETVVWMMGNAGVLGSTSDTEAWILGVLAKKASRIFEFGTCSGRTTYIMGLNARAEAEIITLTLAPEQLTNYVKGVVDDTESTKAALKESRFCEFYYSGTLIASKVTQLFCDSKTLDETPYAASCDLIFIDGSHAYSYVMSDSRKALTMIKPGGLILWHDYKGPRVAAGVFRALNELNRSLKLVHIAGTTLVAHRASL